MMRNAFKLLLVVAAFVAGASTTYAQKLGYINTQELIVKMPERDSVNEKLNALGEELGETLEAIGVEFNNKYNDYQKNLSTMSDSVRQLKEKELQDLQARYDEYQQTAQQEMGKMQNQLMAPIVEKADNAIQKVAKANNVDVVFEETSLAYYNPANLVNLLPLVLKELGIQ